MKDLLLIPLTMHEDVGHVFVSGKAFKGNLQEWTHSPLCIFGLGWCCEPWQSKIKGCSCRTSFNVGQTGDQLVIPTSCLESWMLKFDSKFKRDPDFLLHSGDKS